MRIFETVEELAALLGQEVTVSDWKTVTQEMINQFAQATGDHQWIHVDPEKAKAGPFGQTIAHGFLTLSLIAGFTDESLKIKPVRMGINYGLNKVRFISPVPVGSRLRARYKLLSIEAVAADSGPCWQYGWEVTLELEGAAKPACVAQTLARVYL